MMMRRGRLTEGGQRQADRREREDRAPRLRAEVPRLSSLRVEIEERRGEYSADPAHVRRIVVESAPALFELACGDPHCRDGGHDVTRAFMYELQRGTPTFTGEDACNGSIGSGNCARVLRYVGVATYS